MIILFWLLNFAISGYNAWACGQSWNTTKHVGGVLHFMNWCGAIMSACGFTWCYVILVALLGPAIPIDQDDGTTAPLLTTDQVQAIANLEYLLVIGPILGSGIAITLQAWALAWKRRKLADYGIAAWDTFATVYNLSEAVDYVPKAFGSIGDFFSGDSDDKGKGIVLLLVVFAALAGCLTTYSILQASANKVRVRAAFDRIRAKAKVESNGR